MTKERYKMILFLEMNPKQERYSCLEAKKTIENSNRKGIGERFEEQMCKLNLPNQLQIARCFILYIYIYIYAPWAKYKTSTGKSQQDLNSSPLRRKHLTINPKLILSNV